MNCIIIDDDKLLTKITEDYIKKTTFLKNIGSYSNPIDAIRVLEDDSKVELIFLDIEMPQMTGIEFLSNVKNLPQIIIISSKEKYALKAFDYDVTDYLLKPFSYARFYKAAYKAYSKYIKTNDTEGIFIKDSASSFIRINFEDVYWIEALENYVIIHNFNEKYTIHFTMKAMMNKLPSDSFARVHRSYIVNLKRINRIEDNNIIIKTKDGLNEITIAKSYRDKLLGMINLIDK